MSSNRNVNQRMRAVLYSLKRQYGDRIDIYSQLSVSSDARTGERNIECGVTVIDRAIILPASVLRREIRGISLISANKQLVMGGGYDNVSRVFIIDREDAPDLEIQKDDWIVYGGRKYEIDKFDEFEFDSAWIIAGKAVEGEVPEQIHLLSADNLLTITSLAQR